MTTFYDVTSDVLFPDFLWTYSSKISKDSLVQEIDSLRLSDPKGRSGSNRGGWQSSLFCSYDDDPKILNLKSLEREVGAFVNTQCRNLNADIYVHEMTWWANVSNRYDYNVLHHHTNSTDFIAVYYPKLPLDSGPLQIIRSDAGSYSCLNNHISNGCYFDLQAEEGRVYVLPGHLLHAVLPHTSDEERYSVAFNCCCRPSNYHQYTIKS
jgi:uncharacterized protein (TIGR02466 family)